MLLKSLIKSHKPCNTSVPEHVTSLGTLQVRPYKSPVEFAVEKLLVKSLMDFFDPGLGN
jgi:hypothetical protein